MNDDGQAPATAQGRGGLPPTGRPRKFVIQSSFGNPRERRSRKNRPCDACRRRKTACVITSEPPCLFCQSRGIVCQSSPASTPGSAQDLELHHSPPRHHHPPQPPSHPGHAASVEHEAGIVGYVPPAPAPPPVLPPGSSSSQHMAIPTAASRVEVGELPTPSTTQDSPGHTVASPFGPCGQVHGPESGARPQAYGPAAVVHQNLVHHASPVVEDSGPQQPADVQSPPPIPPVLGRPAPSLEDIVGRTAYHMGPTSEQDTFLLDAFRYGILSEMYNLDANIVQVHPGSSLPDDRPIHFLCLEILHPDYVHRARQAASDAIEAKVWPYGENLVRLYFRHVHPVLPIVSKVRFLRRYHSDKKSVPACLRGALYALASVFWKFDMAIRGTPCPFQQPELVSHAHSALRREIENPNLFILQACLLLIHVTPPAIDSMEAPTTWTLAAQATACAQMIGLHQDPGQWNIEPLEKKLRRKLWWATFVTDCWSSICHGSPPHISASSFNTCLLTIDDVRADEDVPEELRYLVEPPDTGFEVSAGARFMELVSIARHLRTVLDCSYQVNTRAMTINDGIQAQAELFAVQAKLQDWPSLLPSCLAIQHEERRRSSVTSYNCPLHLSFYAAQVLLYRALMYPPTRAAKKTPGSNLRKWFPAALSEFESFAEFLTCINKHDLIGFWGRHARSQLILCGNFLVYLFLLAWERRDIERAYRMLESFHQTIHELDECNNPQAKSLVRAAMLRIDSFFTQAAQIMRHGGDGTVTSMLNHPA